MIVWLFIKSFLSGALTIFKSHWRVIIPILILAYALYQYNAMRIERNAAVSALTEYKAEASRQTIKREAENAIKLFTAKKEIDISTENHIKQIEAIKNDYAKRNKVNVNTIANLRNELREQINRDTFTLPKIEPNTKRTASEWADSHATLSRQYKTLADACTVTTIDYNTLRDWGDTACNQIGCE